MTFNHLGAGSSPAGGTCGPECPFTWRRQHPARPKAGGARLTPRRRKESECSIRACQPGCGSPAFADPERLVVGGARPGEPQKMASVAQPAERPAVAREVRVRNPAVAPRGGPFAHPLPALRADGGRLTVMRLRKQVRSLPAPLALPELQVPGHLCAIRCPQAGDIPCDKGHNGWRAGNCGLPDPVTGAPRGDTDWRSAMPTRPPSAAGRG